jgi:acyl-coenzyme A synthetase/AMP-(fatty) acid ligase
MSDGYLGLWKTQRDARPIIDGHVWHRSGDVAHLDAAGRLWVEGRTVHLVSTVDGIVTPVPIERRIEHALDLSRTAAVGVGPEGAQQVVVVVEVGDATAGLADAALTARVRELIPTPVAAVLMVPALPVDIRHNAKIDRTAVAKWASEVLAGRRARAPW